MSKSTEEKQEQTIGQKAAGLVQFDQIVAQRQMPHKELYIAPWGGFIVIKGLTQSQVEELGVGLAKEVGEVNTPEEVARAKVAMQRAVFKIAIVQPVFTSEQIDKIFEVSDVVLIQWIISEINGLSGEVSKALEQAKEKAEYSFRP